MHVYMLVMRDCGRIGDAASWNSQENHSKVYLLLKRAILVHCKALNESFWSILTSRPWCLKHAVCSSTVSSSISVVRSTKIGSL